MIKRFLFIAVLIAAFSSISYSQWTKVPVGNGLIDTLKANTGGHGVTVDPDGKIWVAAYRPLLADSVFVPDSSKYMSDRPVYVFNANGTPASFSPIKLTILNGKTIALFYGSNTGITTEPTSGNIILSQGFDVVRFDYKTGQTIGHYSDVAGLTKCAVDSAGNVYLGHTLPGYPIKVLNPDLTFNSNAVDTVKDYGRTIEVSRDGNTLYIPRYSGAYMLRYSRASEFDPYTVQDTLFKGFKTESMGWNPVNKALYISAGSKNDMPVTDPTIPGLFYPKAVVGTHYGIDLKTMAIIDSINWAFSAPGADERPRGIAFTKDGKTAYVTAFGGSNYPIIQKYTTTKLPGYVKKDNNSVVASYALSQNYPNPFNPSTEIKFSIAKQGLVTLKVYDMLGKEVATLVNEELTSGNYTTEFNAQNFSSGIYVYQLSANGIILSHKMTLLK